MNGESGRKPVVLVVDDTTANLGVVLELLEEAGLEVLVAEDGQSALERATYARPDLILLDVLMPDLDGFETCQRFKAQPETRDIPVIFMTALADTMDKVRGFEVGAVDYVTKPFQPAELLARVRAHLTIQHLRSKLVESEERLSRIFASTMDAIVTIDRDGVIRLFNAAAERVFRCPASEALGAPFAHFLSGGFRAAIAEYTRPRRDGEAAPKTMWLPEWLTALRADGESFPVEASVSRVDAEGGPLVTVILRDINDLRRAEAENRVLEGLNRHLQDEVRAAVGAGDLVGTSEAMRRVLRAVDQVAATDTAVLVTGETGTGKELAARAVHQRSQRRDRTMVKVNCAAIPAALIESELFGHEKGAFTGAVARRVGRFELAHGGTLFLDEVVELPLDLQPKLLRVLQDGEIERVGGTRTLAVDVRVIAATNRDLERECREGRFRPDLYYRLNVFPIALPPLRERKDDIPHLVGHFVRKFAAKLGKPTETVPSRMMAALTTYGWPGNVRELEHLIERAVVLSDGPALAFPDWPPPSAEGRAPTRVATIEEVERSHILEVLEATGWKVSGARGAAALLGMPATSLETRMKRLGIVRKR